MGRFTGKVALVTGAAQGIGAATARRLHGEGAAVVLADLQVERAREVARSLDGGERTEVVHLDITDVASVQTAVAATLARFGALNHLIGVAGGVPHTLVEGLVEDDWQALIDLNLSGPMHCIRAAIPHLNRGDSMVMVGSVNGLQAWGGEAYSAAKAGLSNLAKNLAVQLGPEGVRINVVAPGTVRTPHWDPEGGPDWMAPMYPLGRVAEPEDIAAAIAFLASDDAAWITGITLPVDGGAGAGPLHARLRGES